MAWAPRILTPAFQAAYRLMGNCCSSTVTVRSEPAPGTVTQRTTPTPVLFQSSTERYPVPSSLFRTRSQVGSEPESAHQSRISSSRDSNPRSRKKSAPQPFQTSRSLLYQLGTLGLGPRRYPRLKGAVARFWTHEPR